MMDQDTAPSGQSFQLDTKEPKSSLSSSSCISLSTADFDTLFEIAKELQGQEDDGTGISNETSLCDSPKIKHSKHRSRSEKVHRHRHRYHHQKKPLSLDTEHCAEQQFDDVSGYTFEKAHAQHTRDESPCVVNRDEETEASCSNIQTLDILDPAQEALFASENSSNDGHLDTTLSDSNERLFVEKTSDRYRRRLSNKAHSTDSASSNTGGSESSSVVGFRRVRSFRITSHGIEKEDLVVKSSKESLKNSFIKRVSRDYGRRSQSPVLKPTSVKTTDRHKLYRVLLLGSEGVGKRAMIHDFMMPDDYLEQLGFSTTEDDDGEKSVSILLDGEESTLEFVDLSDEEISKFITAEQIDAYVVVYSVEDRRSFETAIDRLYEIRQDDGRDVAVILVANKTDLVRTRVIFEEEGKAAAHTYDCKYIEVSAAIDHKIDELLVGILKQIRLIKELRGTKHHHHRRNSGSETKDNEKKFCCPLRAKHTVMERLFGKTKRSAKSCENLYVL